MNNILEFVYREPHDYLDTNIIWGEFIFSVSEYTELRISLAVSLISCQKPSSPVFLFLYRTSDASQQFFFGMLNRVRYLKIVVLSWKLFLLAVWLKIFPTEVTDSMSLIHQNPLWLAVKWSCFSVVVYKWPMHNAHVLLGKCVLCI